MMPLVFVLFFLVFAVLTWINFRLAIALLIIFLPTYLIRTNFGFLPTTLLEISFGAVFIIWLIRYFPTDLPQLKETIKKQRIIFIGATLLLATSLIAALTNPYLLKALGIWRAYFLEPILFFLVISASIKRLSVKFLITSLAISSLSVALLTIWQKLFGTFFPPSLWNDELFGRPTSFFTSPNAIGLYLVPMLLVLSVFLSKFKINRFFYYITILIGFIAVMLSFSQGSWVALAAGIIVLLFLLDYKKIAVGLIITGIVLAVTWPGLRTAILFQDQAGQNRLTIWRYSIEYLTDSPRNFILGSGLRRFFTEVQKPNYDKETLERLIYPHNIFLNFWLETGLAGMMSFVFILAALFSKLRKKFIENKFIRAALFACLVAIIVHGLVDVPYFKNDLSMLFWIIAAIVVLSSQQKQVA